MKQQFYFTRWELIAPSEGDTELKYQDYLDSFNINHVLRTMVIENEQTLVLLNDIHERWEESPIKNKQGRIIGSKREKNVFQSELRLNKEDAERFYKLTSIE